MTSALEGGRWSTSRPGRLYLRERTGTHSTGGRVGPRAGLEWCGKSRPPPGFDHRTVQHIPSRYTDWAIAARFCKAPIQTTIATSSVVVNWDEGFRMLHFVRETIIKTWRGSEQQVRCWTAREQAEVTRTVVNWTEFRLVLYLSFRASQVYNI